MRESARITRWLSKASPARKELEYATRAAIHSAAMKNACFRHGAGRGIWGRLAAKADDTTPLRYYCTRSSHAYLAVGHIGDDSIRRVFQRPTTFDVNAKG